MIQVCVDAKLKRRGPTYRSTHERLPFNGIKIITLRTSITEHILLFKLTGNGLIFEGKNTEKGCQDKWVTKCQNFNRMYTRGAIRVLTGEFTTHLHKISLTGI